MGALEITWKDLRLLARDRRAAAVLLALPLIFIAIIGMSTGQLMQAREGGSDVHVAVVNEVLPSTETAVSAEAGTSTEASADTPSTDVAMSDAQTPDDEADAPRDKDTELVREAIDKIKSHEHFIVTEVPDHERALENLDRGKAIVVLVFGKEFPARVRELELKDILRMDAGRLAEGPRALDLTIETKPSLAKLGELSGALIYGDIVQVIAPKVAANSSNLFVRKAVQVAQNRESSDAKFQGVTLIEQKRKSTGVLYDKLVPSYTVLFVFFLVNIMARSFISERELGTLRRLRMAPIRPVAILIGKNVPFYLLSLVQTTALFLFGRLLFGMSWGAEPWLLVPIIMSTSLAATALGLMVATIIRTDSQVSAYGNSLVIILAGISGCFMPRDWLPDVMQKLSLGTPHAWALMAYDELLSHEHIIHAEIFKSCGMLLAFAAAFFTVGWLRFRRIDG
jgi:ABC-2 type transport system permease protein